MKEHIIEKKIYYHDTDCGGVVYYANYLKYLEEGRSEYCISKGVNLRQLADAEVLFVVAHTEINYRSPGRYQDKLKVITSVEKIGNTSIQFIQNIARDNKAIIDSKTIWVCVGSDFKPRPVPADTRRLLSA